jgi:hypothetical protein
MRSLLVGLAFVVGLGPPASAAGPVLPLPAEDAQEIASLLGQGVVGKALPSEPIDASVYFPLVERSSTFQVTGGKNAGKTQTLRTLRGQRPGGNEAWRFELSPSLAGFLSQAGESLTMPAVSDSGEGVIVVTTPANPFLVDGMQPGETREFSQQVSVNYLDDPSDRRYAGQLTGTYTYVGTYEVKVPAGTFPAALLRQKYTGKVGPAHTQDTAYYFFAPKVGVVAMISQEDVEAFWIIHIDTSSGKVLATP